MSKKTIQPKIFMESNGIKVEKNAGFFSLFATTIDGVMQKIFLIAMRVVGKEKEEILALPKSKGMTTKTEELPGSVWDFGCSACAAGEIAAFYDQEKYPNLYTGPTNDGVMPLDENPWPTFTDSSAADPSPEGDNDVNGIYYSDPLVASKQEVDGRTSRGSIDDYWVEYNSNNENDPYTGSSEGGSVPH